MRTLSTQLQSLVSQRVLAEIPFVKITRVIDQTPPITSPDLTEPFYAFTHPVNELFGPPADEPNVPFLVRIAFPVETMPHLPSPVSGGVDTLTRRISFALVNAEYQGQDLYDFLTSEARLDRAQLVLDTLIVPTREMGTIDEARSFINGNKTLGETVPFFSGFIDRVTAVGDLIECRGKTTNPVTPWKLVPDEGSDPRDRGLRLPMVFGKDAAVRCVNLVVGAFTSLNSELSIGATQAVLLDGTNFPDSGSAMVNAEAISWTSKNGNLLDGVTRGELGSTEADHIAGGSVIELDTLTMGVSSESISSVTGLFLRSQISDTVIRVPSLAYSVDYDDETTEPGESGSGIVTITMTSGQLATVVNGVLADAAVTQQAVYVTDAAHDIIGLSAPTVLLDNVTFSRTAGAFGDWTTVTTAPNWTINKSSGVQEGLRGTFGDGMGVNGAFSLLNARFSFTIDVDVCSAAIDVGIVASGLEDSLTGFIDGNLVAGLTIPAGATGVFLVQGVIFQAVLGEHVVALENAVLDFILGEPTGGNPTCDFDVTDVSCGFTYVDSLDAVTESAQPSVRATNTAVSAIDGPWTTTPMQQTVDTVGGPADTLLDVQWVDTDFPLIDGLPDGGLTDISAARIDFTVTVSELTGAQGVAAGMDASVGMPGGTSEVLNFTRLTDSTLSGSVEFALPGGDVLDDFLNVVVKLINLDSAGEPNGVVITFDSVALILTSGASDAVIDIEQSVDAQIQASAGGIGLEFYAICDGPEAPDGTYNAASGEVLEHPCDLMRYWLETIHGQTNVDTATFSGLDYFNATSGYRFGFDARNLGDTFESVLLRLGYEGSANVAQPSGGDWTITFPQNVIASGLVGRWEAEGDGLDTSVNSNDLTLSGGATFTPVSRVGAQAFLFDGVDDRALAATATELPTGSTDRTLACWVFSSDFAPAGGNRMLMGWGTASANEMSSLVLGLNASTDRRFSFWGFSNDLTSLGQLVNDAWNHIAFTLAGTTGTLYLNGVLDTTGTVSGLATDTSTDFLVGDFTSVMGNFGGNIDEVLVYDRALTAEEIKSLGTAPDHFFAQGTGPTIDSIGDLISIGKDDDEIETRLTVFSHFDPRFENADNRSFTQVQTTDPTDALVIAREVEFGRNDADPHFLLAHNQASGVTQWRGYIEQELGRFARIFSFRVDWFGGGYELEIGDVVAINHPRVDAGVDVKCRVIEVEHNRERGIQVRLAEVL